MLRRDADVGARAAPAVDVRLVNENVLRPPATGVPR
jgi:hypothetical protein